MDKKYVGFITINGVLHLYEEACDLRKDLNEWDRDWSRVAWIEGIEYHNKDVPSSCIYPEGTK